jgi:hypothetical protein
MVLSIITINQIIIIIDIIISCHHHCSFHNSKMCVGWLMVGWLITWFSDLQIVSVSSSSSNHHANSALSRSRALSEDTTTEETLPTPPRVSVFLRLRRERTECPVCQKDILTSYIDRHFKHIHRQ